MDRVRTLKLWLAGATILFFAFFAWITLFRAGPYGIPGHQWGSPAHRTDFTVYRDAAAAVLHGQDPYAIRNVRGWAYVYPPPYSIVMVPFALLPLPVSVLAWYFVCAGLTISSVSMAGRLAGTGVKGGRKRLAILFIPALIVAVWFTVGLTRGQASVLMSWLVIAAIFWDKKERTTAGAACLAGAVLLKAFALTLLFYYAWRGKWKMVSATLVAILLGGLVLPSAVFGWHGNLHYIGEWTREVAGPALGSESSRSTAQHGEAPESGFGFGNAEAGGRRPNEADGSGSGCGAGVTDLASGAKGECAVGAADSGSLGGMDAARFARGRRSLLLTLRFAGGIRAGPIDERGATDAPVRVYGPDGGGPSERRNRARYWTAL